VIVRAIQRTRQAIETFEEKARTHLDEVRERQEETNRLLREHLADEESETQ
jgi:hypothetical protein